MATTQNPPSNRTSEQAWDAKKSAKDAHKALEERLEEFRKENRKELKSGNQAIKAEHDQLQQAVAESKEALADTKKAADKAVKTIGKDRARPIAEKYLGRKEVNKATKKALKAGEFHGGTFKGTYVGEKEKGILAKSVGWITGSNSKTVTSRKLESKLGELKRAEQSLERVKDNPLATEKMGKQVLKLKTEIQEEAKKIFPQLFNAKNHHTEAQNLLEEQRNKAIWKSETNFQEATKTYKGDDRTIKRLTAELKAEQEKINKIYDEASKPHKKFIEKASALEGEIEQISGVKAADHVSVKALSSSVATLNESEAAKLKAETGFSGIKNRVVRNAFEGGVSGKAKVGFGAAFLFDGLRRVKNAFVPGNDPDGQPQPMDITQAVIGTVEGAGGLFLAQHGQGRA